jgi:tryptophanyl-tRNA synthetase
MLTLVSGIQPSGNLHLGNYLGVLRKLRGIQLQKQCFFPIADLHAITVNIKPEDLRQSTMQTVAIYLACGLDPDKSSIFIQSHVKEHTELAWILNCMVPLGALKRMTQFKSKATKTSSLGLLSYPVLMAADILLYKANFVQVGADQKQHLELTRDIAAIFNRKYKKIFELPDALSESDLYTIIYAINKTNDNFRKMSKSDPSDYSRINLLDNPDLIRKKFKKAETDSLLEVGYEPETRPAVSNLVEIYAQLSFKTTCEVEDLFYTSGLSNFKEALAELTISHFNPIQRNYNRIIKDESYIKDILKRGADKAREKAAITMKEINELMGFYV